MKVLVIRANGHAGSTVVEALEARREVVGVGRSTAPSVGATDPTSIEWVRGDCRREDLRGRT